MTNWIPDIRRGDAPLYIRIADAIEADMGSGELLVGNKLPPQRNLAYDIGVTIGTIGRGYQLAIERGLVAAEVGRGTFVLAQGEPSKLNVVRPEDEGNMADPLRIRGWETEPHFHRMNSSSAPDIGQAAALTPILASIIAQEPAKVLDYVRQIEPEWQQAGARWLGNGSWKPDPNTIIPTQGAHAAMMSIIATCTAPGDKVAFEDLTYASLARSVMMMGRRVVSVRTGPDGLDPDSFESLCAQQHPKLLVVVPTLQNPTASIMPLEHRVRVVETARQHNVLIVEDNIYGVQVANAPAPIAELAPERTFHVSSLSKCVAAGLRAGWISAPLHFRNRVTVANKSVTGGNTYLGTELAARLVNSGAAHDISREIREISRRREKMVRGIFAGCTINAHPCASYFWLLLEDPWISATFKMAARKNNILIDDADHFKVNRDDRSPHRVRISVGSITDEKIVRQNLFVLRDLLDGSPAGYDDYS